MAMISSQTFGDLLRRYRLAAGLTQEELAAQAGLSVRGLSDLERAARRSPRRETVQLLTEALQLSPAERALLEAAARPRGGTVAQASRGSGASALIGVPEWPLVGRAQELALLDQLVTDGPPVLLVAGEPGIGKSRLLQAGIERAEARGWTVLQGGCHRRSGQDPYAPVVSALADALRRQSPAQQRLQLRGSAWLVRLLPELAETDAVSPPAWTLPPEQERRLMFSAVARYLMNVAGPAGTLLVLDDLHWAGPDALDLLQTLVRVPAERPLRILGAYRDTDVRPQDPLTLFAADLTREGRASRALLAPLTEPEATTLLAELMPETAGGDPHLRQQVLERAGGVPLFLVSCVQALGTGSLTWNGVSHVPWTLREAILQRVAALPEAAQQLLRLAAVIGSHVPRSVLVAVAARSDLTEERVLEALEASGRGRMLVEAGEDAYQFTHNLIREVLLAELGTAWRALLHRRVAEALEQGPGAPPLEVLAYHYAHSGVTDKAVFYLERAGDAARARYAHADATEAYQEVVIRLEALGQTGEKARVQEKLGEALTFLAYYEQAVETLEAAAASYRLTGDLEGQLRVLAQMGIVHRWRGTAQEGLQRLLPWTETLATFPPSPGAASFYVSLAQLYFGVGHYGEQLAMAEQAAAIARSLDDQRLLVAAQGRRGSALLVLGRLAEAYQALSEEVIPLAEKTGDVQTWRQTLINLGAISTYQGAFIQARAFLEQAIPLTEQLSDRAGLAFLAFQHGLSAFHLGEWSQAHTDFQQAANLVPMGALAAYPLGGLGLLSLAEGGEGAASRYFTEALTQAEQHHDARAVRWIHGMLAEQDLLAGLPERAHARLAPLLEHDHPQEGDIDVKELLPMLAWIYVELGDLLQAQELLERLLAETRAAQMRLALAEALRVQGLLATRQGRWQEAEAALEEALALTRAFPYPYGEAKLLMGYGYLQLQRSEREQAQQCFEAARSILSQLGERLYARQIEQMLGLGERQ